MKTKRCPVCGEYKPYSEYYKDKSRLDGLYNHCKTCQKVYARAWTSTHMDKHSKYVKRWADEHKDKVREAGRKYMKKRYNNDPVYREKKKAYGRAWYKAHPRFRSQD
jgi:phage FluMu protein Com